MIDDFRDFNELESKQYSNYLQDLFASEPNQSILHSTNNTLSEDEIKEIRRLASKDRLSFLLMEFSSEVGDITCYINDDKIYVTDMRIKYER